MSDTSEELIKALEKQTLALKGYTEAVNHLVDSLKKILEDEEDETPTQRHYLNGDIIDAGGGG